MPKQKRIKKSDHKRIIAVASMICAPIKKGEKFGCKSRKNIRL